MTLEECESWEKNANEGKDPDDPKWQFDYSRKKVDFDGALIKVYSRFFAPDKKNSRWRGEIHINLDMWCIKRFQIEAENLDELKEKVEKALQSYSDNLHKLIILIKNSEL